MLSILNRTSLRNYEHTLRLYQNRLPQKHGPCGPHHLPQQSACATPPWPLSKVAQSESETSGLAWTSLAISIIIKWGWEGKFPSCQKPLSKGARICVHVRRKSGINAWLQIATLLVLEMSLHCKWLCKSFLVDSFAVAMTWGKATVGRFFLALYNGCAKAFLRQVVAAWVSPDHTQGTPCHIWTYKLLSTRAINQQTTMKPFRHSMRILPRSKIIEPWAERLRHATLATVKGGPKWIRDFRFGRLGLRLVTVQLSNFCINI